jgi:hypothetical protein
MKSRNRPLFPLPSRPIPRAGGLTPLAGYWAGGPDKSAGAPAASACSYPLHDQAGAPIPIGSLE